MTNEQIAKAKGITGLKVGVNGVVKRVYAKQPRNKAMQRIVSGHNNRILTTHKGYARVCHNTKKD